MHSTQTRPDEPHLVGEDVDRVLSQVMREWHGVADPPYDPDLVLALGRWQDDGGKAPED